MPLRFAFDRVLRVVFVLRTTFALRADRAASVRLPRAFGADFGRFDCLPDFVVRRLVALAMGAPLRHITPIHSARLKCVAPVLAEHRSIVP